MRTDDKNPEPVIAPETALQKNSKALHQSCGHRSKENYLKTPGPHPPKYETIRGPKSRACQQSKKKKKT